MRLKVTEIEIFQVAEWTSLTSETVFPKHVSDSDRFKRHFNFGGSPDIQYPYQPDCMHPVLKKTMFPQIPNDAITKIMNERFEIIHKHGRCIFATGQKFCLYRRRLEVLLGYEQDKIIRFLVPPNQIVACYESTLQCFGINNAMSGMIRSGTNGPTSKTHRQILSETKPAKFRTMLTNALNKLNSSPYLIISYFEDDDEPKGEDLYDIAVGGITASKAYLDNKLHAGNTDMGLVSEFLFACRLVKFEVVDEFEKMNIPTITYSSSAAVDNLMCAWRAWKSHHLRVGSRPNISVPSCVQNDYLQLINMMFPGMEPVLAPSKHVEIDDEIEED